MLCENGYYPNGTGENRKPLYCSNPKSKEDMFKGKCPFVYWCQVDRKFENTADMFECVFRERKE